MGFLDISNKNINYTMKNCNILVDTNVLYWVFYGKSTFVNAKQKIEYQSFFQKNIKNNKYFVTTLTINELFTIIEKNEYELYCDREGINKDEFSLKKFRRKLDMRENIKNNCSLIYKQIQQSMEVKECCLDKKVLISYIDNYTEMPMDCNDFVLVEFCKENDIDGILTDDADFKCVKEDFDIYSANQKFSN